MSFSTKIVFIWCALFEFFCNLTQWKTFRETIFYTVLLSKGFEWLNEPLNFEKGSFKPLNERFFVRNFLANGWVEIALNHSKQISKGSAFMNKEAGAS